MCLRCEGFSFPKPLTRLRLGDGRYVFLEWHDYLGPVFYQDRAGRREVRGDLVPATNELVWRAFEWWHGRGKLG